MTDHPAPPLLFLDTETIHLDPFLGSVWEIAFMRYEDREPTVFQVVPLVGLADPKALEVGRYAERFDADTAAARTDVEDALVKALADRPALAGSAPWFDAAHLAVNFGVGGLWHHHHLDVPTLLAGSTMEGDPEPPWRLSQAAEWAGIDLDGYDRHTAAGDVLLTRDLYRAWRVGA